MNNKKCPNCGFINFLKDESCRKCSTNLDAPGQPDETCSSSPYAFEPGYQNQYHQPAAKKGFPLLKVFLFILVGLIVFSALTGAATRFLTSKVEWREFRPSGAAVTVMMPKEPTAHDPVTQTLAFGSMTNHMYTATVGRQGSALYLYVDYSVNISSPDVPYEKLLDGELDALVKRTNSTLISKQSITVGGNPGLQFEMKPPSNFELSAARTFGKFFIAKNQLYLLGITATEGSELFSGKDTFLNPTVQSL